MAELRFDNRVVIVTGAGGGLGRTYALEYAKRGAKVVVNDLGGDRHGTAASTSAADNVVKEIKQAGGTAVANYDSVEFGDKIVETAIKNFGRVDVVVNNAGILRDVSFPKMTDLDWELIMKVHLKGAYAVTKAAWPYFRKQNYGRVIVTSSNSGLYGSFGQANYSAAKMALVGFAKTLALEGQKYNITSNILVPTAGSRLTETVMPKDLVDALKPEFVTPLVVYLTHESFTETGQIYEGGAGWFGTVQFYRSKGAVLGSASAEKVRDNWSAITDMSQARNYKNNELIGELMQALSDAKSVSAQPNPPQQTAIKRPGLESAVIFDEIAKGVAANPTGSNVKAIVLYILQQKGKEVARFTLDLKNEPHSLYEGDVKNGGKANTTLVVDDADFVKLANGNLNPQKAFMTGKIKIKGNIMLMQRVQGLLQQAKKAKL